MESKILAKTPSDNKIEVFEFSKKAEKSVLIIGGVHGDEKEAIYVAEKLLKCDEIYKLIDNLNIFILPKLNPDGCAKNTRQNSNGVDLNRNMPTKDWTSVSYKEKYNPGPSPSSEIETKTLINLIEEIKPACIISFHCYEPMINYNGACKNLAKRMSEFNGYKITDNIGYPTPGSLGTWAGIERNIPVITFEIESGCGEQFAWEFHKSAILAGIQFISENDNL